MAEIIGAEVGQVEATNYALKKSFQARNVEDMNSKMGYHDLSDLSNTPRPVTPVRAAKSNPQMGPEAANPSKNDRKGKAY
jgi:hypothetical protein